MLISAGSEWSIGDHGGDRTEASERLRRVDRPSLPWLNRQVMPDTGGSWRNLAGQVLVQLVLDGKLPTCWWGSFVGSRAA
jgi:hypothetical protein